jgi:hypothetical protein
VCVRADVGVGVAAAAEAAPEAAALSPMHGPRPALRKEEAAEPGTWTSALFSPVLKFFGNEEGTVQAGSGREGGAPLVVWLVGHVADLGGGGVASVSVPLRRVSCDAPGGAPTGSGECAFP